MMPISNEKVQSHPWLSEMYADTYFPKFLVDKLRGVLVELCEQIEREQPQNLESLLKLTHAATERINDLAVEFEANGSQLETAARDAMASEFGFIVAAYGFPDVDIEEVIAPRDW
jgi:hypothetical protein